MTTLETITLISVNVAMGIVVVKALSRPLERIVNALNPFKLFNRLNRHETRIDEIEMKRFQDEQEWKELSLKIKKLEKTDKVEKS